MKLTIPAVLLLGATCLAQPPAKVQVGKLVIESKTLPDADRRQVIRKFEHFTYDGSETGIREEFAERIRAALRDLGYMRAAVDEPTFSFATANRGERVANVTVKVDEGAQYRFGSIQFQNATLFPKDQLRKLFALQDGDLYSASKFADGLQHLRDLYQAEGYLNFVAAPQPERNEQSHTVEFLIDVDPGRQFYFGQLILDGLEPHAGAGQSLLNSWKTLQGKQYSPIVLQQWLVTNRSDWQDAKHTSQPISAKRCGDPITQMQVPESRVVNIKLSFPQTNPFGSH